LIVAAESAESRSVRLGGRTASSGRSGHSFLEALLVIVGVLSAWPAGAAESAGAPSAAPPGAAPHAAPSAEHAKGEGEAQAKIHDTVVFSLRHGHGGKSADERAHAASEALEHAVEAEGEQDVKVAPQGDARVVFAGETPIVELYAEDVEGSGSATLETLAASVSGHVGEAVAAEKKRSDIAGTVFSISLLVFFGLVAFYVLQKIGEFFQRIRQWMLDNPDRITGIRIQSQEVVGPTALRGGVLIMLIVGRFVAQVGVFYVWLVFALSLFQSTRPLTAKLTGFVVTPLSDLAARLAASLPLAVMAVVSAVAVYVLLRFVQLFFEGVARRQTVLPWLPPDLAGPTSLLVRVGVVVVALVLVAPLVTGDANGVLARAGFLALGALGLAATPLLASVIVGVLVVYGRRVRIGEHVEIGGREGRVLGIGLVDVRLRDRDGCELRVPHLLTLIHPTRVLGIRPRASIEVSTGVGTKASEVRRVLADAAATLGDSPAVELAHIDAESAHFRVMVSANGDKTLGDVRMALVDALGAAGIPLGRSRFGAGP
jgi:small-conductance mechanosensitive channel